MSDLNMLTLGCCTRFNSETDNAIKKEILQQSILQVWNWKTGKSKNGKSILGCKLHDGKIFITVWILNDVVRNKLIRMPLKKNSILILLDVNVDKNIVVVNDCEVLQVYDKVIGSPKKIGKKKKVMSVAKATPLQCPGCKNDLSEFGENFRREHIRACCPQEEEKNDVSSSPPPRIATTVKSQVGGGSSNSTSRWSDFVEKESAPNKIVDKKNLRLFKERSNKITTTAVNRKKNKRTDTSTLDYDGHKSDPYLVEKDEFTILQNDVSGNTKRKKQKMTTYIDDYPSVVSDKPSLGAKALFALKKVFGHDSFRGRQKDIVLHASRRLQDTFVLMPTGGGKSLCFQLPALLSRGVTVVVSPLLSLIQDQITALIKFGIPAACFDAALGKTRAKAIYRELYREPEPYMKILYVTPEKLHQSEPMWECFRELKKRDSLARFVIDEAHCVSQWGHDFRTSYKKLSRIRREFQDVPIMALTATATPNVQKDICKILRMRSSKTKCFKASFDRPNLRYSVLKKPSKKIEALEMLCKRIKSRHKNQTGIVYCLSRDECSTVSRYLVSQGVRSEPYHAGMTTQERTQHQIRWQNGNCDVICATIAYGMGIDKADVRYVFHFCLPKSIEGYYQESGRAGRDGNTSDCIIYFNQTDAGRLKRMFKRKQPGTNRRPSPKQIERNMNALEHVVTYCKDKTSKCRRVQLLSFFHEEFDSKNCRVKCDHCASSSYDPVVIL